MYSERYYDSQKVRNSNFQSTYINVYPTNVTKPSYPIIKKI